LVRLYHDADAVPVAEARYDAVARGALPTNMPERILLAEEAPGGQIEVAALAVLLGMAKSKGEARRLIDNRGVRIDGALVAERTDQLDLLVGPRIFQIGKNAFCRVRWGG
jgi:tyrosyl-tRNA synthetase